MSTPTKARNTDLETSWEAAAKADLPGSQAVVLSILREFGPLSHSDLYWKHTFSRMLTPLGEGDGYGYSESRLRTAAHELVDKGLVVADGTKLNGRGRHETIWKLADAAR